MSWSEMPKVTLSEEESQDANKFGALLKVKFQLDRNARMQTSAY